MMIKDPEEKDPVIEDDRYYEGFFVDFCKDLTEMIGVGFVLAPTDGDVTVNVTNGVSHTQIHSDTTGFKKLLCGHLLKHLPSPDIPLGWPSHNDC